MRYTAMIVGATSVSLAITSLVSVGCRHDGMRRAADAATVGA